uniref:Uncharacterized protein n=1 Tax=Nelumbo nucifera TaxID=4432 RepID=A0A822Y2A7_NELNU|nr:TPA_asm: hypothetical protein HUJ06_027561 [Nelumbo nucifera]
MCYKYLWDNVVSDNFPSDHFFDFFRLNPEITLSKEIKEQTASSGFPAQVKDFPITDQRSISMHYKLVLFFMYLIHTHTHTWSHCCLDSPQWMMLPCLTHVRVQQHGFLRTVVCNISFFYLLNYLT